MASTDRKVNVNISTTSDTRGIEDVRARLDALEKEAKATGKSFDQLAASEFGDLSGVFDEFFKEIANARKQLGELGKQGVDVRVAASGLDQLETQINNLRAEIGVDVKTDEITEAKREIDKLSQEETVKIDVADGEVQDSQRKVDRIGASKPVVKVDVADREIEQAQKKADQLEQQVNIKVNVDDGEIDQAQRKAGSLGAGLAGGLGGLSKAATGSIAAFASLTSVLAGFSQGVRNASRTEDLEAQLKILLGSAEAAKERLAELRDFAATTPFQLPGIVEASRILETVTQGALSYGDGLRLVGDLAAGTGEDLANLSIHVGRLYDGLQNGAPVGESMLRLQELGIITAKTRREIEDLQASGARGDEVWQIAARDFARFSGAMEERSKTLSGVWSTLKDNFNLLLSTMSQPVKDGLTVVLKEMIPVVQGATIAIGGLFRWLGLVEKQSKDTGDTAQASYQKMGEAAAKAATAAQESARTQRRSSTEVVTELDRLLARLNDVTEANQRYADAIKDRKVAEIEARTDLTDEEKRTAIFQIESNARIAAFEREQDAIANARRTALEEIAALESFAGLRSESIRTAQDELADLQETIKLREKLASIEDRAQSVRREYDEERKRYAKELAFDERNIGEGRQLEPRESTQILGESVAALETNLRIAERAAERARARLDELQVELPDEEIVPRAEALSKTIASLTAELDGLRAKIAATQAETPSQNDVAREQRRNANIFREQERAAQAQFQGGTNSALERNQQATSQEIAKRIAAAQKDIEASQKGLIEQAQAVLDLAQDRGQTGEFFDRLEALVGDLADGASAEELSRLTAASRALAKSKDDEAAKLGSSLQDLLAAQEESQRRIAELESKLATLQEPNRADVLGRRVDRATERAAEASREVEGQVADPRLAEELRGAREALADGATIAEAQALRGILREVNTATSAGLRAAVQEAQTQANIIPALIGDLQRELARLNRELGTVQQQLKNQR